ncbi:phosphatase PAP2 family protein [Amycolatopsis sp. SID8362]|uniref:phosphatase PAP2 family protein n=1 Tax=Amycolatopsis sp. SID8362 TaxID=2690346 RepID=UPI001370C362|nr:phosphatase PAP2 family protein [Amycolatopsis sp. SID8362]NBH04511.1 phosphatase PAP2 family protein [Amycolatopsis sp. SID8362]NED41210.1 phosphatase PAP2 family protein [Amycolatopsis sp. SID8362]
MTVPLKRWLVVGLALAAAFVALGLGVARHPLTLDSQVANALHGVYAQPLGRVAQLGSDVLGPVLPFVLGAALLALALRQRQHTGLCVRLAVVLVLCRLTSVVFKPLFLRARPRDYPDLSYPSGHVTAVASTGFVLVLLCAWLWPRLVKRVLLASAVAVVLSAACRVVLGVHWVSDTIGAVLAVTGVGLLSACALRLLPPGDGRSLDG